MSPSLVQLGTIGALAAFVVIVAALVLWSRRRFDRDLRGVLGALEDLRAGEAGGRCDVPGGSPLALVADAVNRLGADLHGVRVEAEAAHGRWSALSDAAQDTAILTTDTDGDIRSFSSGAAKLFGWQESEVLARPAAVIFDEGSYKELLPKLARRSLRSQGITARARLLRRDGASFPAEVAVRMLSATGGQPIGFMMVVRDVSVETRLESDLRESEERFRGLVEGMAAAVFIVRGGRVLYGNPAALALCGRSERELVGASFREFVAGRDLLVFEEALSRIERKLSLRDEWGAGLCAAGGGHIDARIVASAVEFAGRAAALLVVHDETAASRTAAELRRNEAKLDAVLEAASDGILVLSEAAGGGSVQMVNRAFAALVGLDERELLGAEAQRLWARLRGKGGGFAVFADELARGAAGQSEWTLDGADAPREVRLRVAELRGPAGEPLGRLVVCRDLSEQRRSERSLTEQAERLQLGRVELEQAYGKLREANAALEARSEELDRVNLELRRLDEMKSNLLGNVSHELQTPLVSIRGYTEMVLRERLGPINEEQRKGLALSLKSIDRLIAMIDNLLAFARTDPGEARLDLEHFDLRPLIQEALDLLGGEIAAKEIAVSIEMEDDGTRIHGDRDRLLEVLLNLLSNAVKFNRPKGEIRVSSKPGQSGYAAVTVRDSGVGIPQESIGRIFDRHFRVERPESAATEGSGLGLSIVRDILRLHGCTIHVDSEEGRGTAFTFTLPLGAAPRAEPAATRHEEPSPPPPAADPEPGRTHEEPSRRPRLRIIRRFKSER